MFSLLFSSESDAASARLGAVARMLLELLPQRARPRCCHTSGRSGTNPPSSNFRLTPGGLGSEWGDHPTRYRMCDRISQRNHENPIGQCRPFMPRTLCPPHASRTLTPAGPGEHVRGVAPVDWRAHGDPIARNPPCSTVPSRPVPSGYDQRWRYSEGCRWRASSLMHSLNSLPVATPTRSPAGQGRFPKFPTRRVAGLPNPSDLFEALRL